MISWIVLCLFFFSYVYVPYTNVINLSYIGVFVAFLWLMTENDMLEITTKACTVQCTYVKHVLHYNLNLHKGLTRKTLEPLLIENLSHTHTQKGIFKSRISHILWTIPYHLDLDQVRLFIISHQIHSILCMRLVKTNSKCACPSKSKHTPNINNFCTHREIHRNLIKIT